VSSLSDEQLLDLMAEHPTLIRRPLLVEGDELVVGFDQGAYTQRFGAG
jgi:arsenate reductase-like glutaredoxin family protein